MDDVHRGRRSATGRIAALLVFGLVSGAALASGAALLPVAVARADTDITVDIGDDRSGSTSTGTGTAVAPAGNSATIAPGQRVVFVVSGLSVTGTPTANPIAGGTVTVQLTVQNLTDQALDASAEFHVDDVFGNALAESSTQTITGLAPDELRTVTVDLGEVRFAGLAHACATVTPPEKVGDIALAPVDRDAWAMLPSWYAFGVFVAGAVSVGTWAYLRYRRML